MGTTHLANEEIARGDMTCRHCVRVLVYELRISVVSVALERVRRMGLCSGWDVSKSTDNSMIRYLYKSFLEVKK